MPSRTWKPAAAWVEFAWISNELARPNLLVCPSDTETTRMATDFSNDAKGGFLHAAYRNHALSYFLGTDVYSEYALSIVAGDRNIRVDAVGATCSAGYNSVADVRHDLGFPTQAAWTNGIHRSGGNLLFNDGRVQMVPDSEFLSVWIAGHVDGAAHLLMPR